MIRTDKLRRLALRAMCPYSSDHGLKLKMMSYYEHMNFELKSAQCCIFDTSHNDACGRKLNQTSTYLYLHLILIEPLEERNANS